MMLGLLATPGTTTVAFATDAITTLRSAVTALQVKGEQPTGWALNPVDAQAIDLLRWGTSGGLLTEGYATGVAPGGDPSSSNIFGPDVKRVVLQLHPGGRCCIGRLQQVAHLRARGRHPRHRRVRRVVHQEPIHLPR